MRIGTFTAALAALLLLAASQSHGSEAKVRCQLSFKMSGWSLFYKTSSGTGVVKCSNGQSASVKLDGKGGGLSVGRSEIENGRGEFSPVTDISELFGSYLSAEAHAGAVKSVKAQAMTKGEVSLALAGKGRGFDLGIAFGALRIDRQ